MISQSIFFSLCIHNVNVMQVNNTIHLLNTMDRFEAALKEVDATICVPYWDSSLDSMLNNPAASYIWSDDFFGNWNGEALTGRMTGNWNTPLGVSLR